MIQAACSKGPSLLDCDEETSTGENLMFALLLFYFSLRSIPLLSPGLWTGKNFLNLQIGCAAISTPLPINDFGMGKAGHDRARVIAKNTWWRLIVEEMAISLAAPSLASKSFINHHKPAVHVAVCIAKASEIS
ncbi:hypothetical protein NC653_004899 [Populus alba x Populus x berolinensis]|uniref:Uncharacterized protein n=1 Tax=Populus alba x Populus x berolinensis TaxID=444605 RepID=A0AAD6RBP0_9ROSI|nr:hypothetical protein NC653_004899 [Populus alba x Populus x berolinensis]